MKNKIKTVINGLLNKNCLYNVDLKKLYDKEQKYDKIDAFRNEMTEKINEFIFCLSNKSSEAADIRIKNVLKIYKTCIKYRDLYFKDSDFKNYDLNSLENKDLLIEFFLYDKSTELFDEMIKYIGIFNKEPENVWEEINIELQKRNCIDYIYKVCFEHIDLCNAAI